MTIGTVDPRTGQPYPDWYLNWNATHGTGAGNKPLPPPAPIPHSAAPAAPHPASLTSPSPNLAAAAPNLAAMGGGGSAINSGGSPATMAQSPTSFGSMAGTGQPNNPNDWSWLSALIPALSGKN